MDFVAVVDQVIALLRQRGRMTYRTLQRQFQLDDNALHDLKDELLYAHPEVRDDAGRGLVWTGDADTAPAAHSASMQPPGQAPLAYTPPYLVEKIRTSTSALEGERKQVTVLFADLKGSMELLADRDPEEARAILDPVLERMMEAVHRYEGTVNQVMGDGIMALFGAPIAHEDHAVRACYAALHMQETVTRYGDEMQRAHGVPVQIRVGLHSGDVVVRGIDSSLHMDYTAVGQTTHLAARMEQMAKPGSVLVTAETLQRAEGHVQVQPLGPVAVKGVAAPMEVFALVGAGPTRTLLQAFAARGLTRFVGRQLEIDALHQALGHAAAGHGQIVAIIGEPGVGKTRLCYECTHAQQTHGWLVLESSAVSYGQATPYLPVRALLQTYFQIDGRDDARTIRAKVTGKLVTLDATLGITLPAFLTLLDVAVEDASWQALDPPQRRQRTLQAFKALLLRESQVQPVLLVCENLHWIDAETQALLESLLESLPTARLLLLVNYRPEYQHGWGQKSSYTQLWLDPLPQASAEDFLDVLLGEDPGLTPFKRLLIARTEGNPFFLEESVRTLVERGVLVGAPGAYRLAQALADIQVPATVQAVLAARIDRLPPDEKRLLQAAAVIGTDVPFLLLQALGEIPEATLRSALTHLQAAEFLYETHLFPELEYTFKHALTQQVAYESLLRERRRALHARIVEALEALAEDRVAEQVERLAHHALRGEVWDKALAYCRQAGDKVEARSAYPEAVGYFEQALSALAHLPETRETREQAIDLRLALRTALWPSGDFVRTLACLREAETLALALDDARRLGQVSIFLAHQWYTEGAYDQAAAAAERALALAVASGEVILQARAHQSLAVAYQFLGHYRRAIDCLTQAVVALDGVGHRERFGTVILPAVLARAYLAWCQAELGLFAEGRSRGEEGLRIAEAVAQPGSLMMAAWAVGLLALRQGDILRALPRLEQAVTLCQTTDLPFYFPRMAAALGAAYTLGGRGADAVSLLTRALAQTTATGMVGDQALCRLALEEALLLAGRLEEAHALAARTLALARAHQERGHEAYALHLLGEIAARREPLEHEQAEAHYRQALALAEELGTRPLQAHCHRRLGTLYATTGQQEEACTELSTAIGMYKSMNMTFWLPQTEATLAQVEGQ